MNSNPGAAVVSLFIVFVVLGGFIIALRGGDIGAFTEITSTIAVPIVFIALAIAAVSAFSS
jgi:hypothetical protein